VSSLKTYALHVSYSSCSITLVAVIQTNSEVVDYTRTVEVKCEDQLGQKVSAKFILYKAVDKNADGKADSDSGVLGAGHIYYIWKGKYDCSIDVTAYSSDGWTKWTYKDLETTGGVSYSSGELRVNDDGTVTIKYTRYYKVVVNHTDGGTTNPEGTFWKVHGDSLTAKATPNPGYVFKKWVIKYKSGSTWTTSESTSRTITVTIDKPHILTAVFELEPGKSSLTVRARMHCGYSMDQGDPIYVKYRVNNGNWITKDAPFTTSNLKSEYKVELKLAMSFPFVWNNTKYTTNDSR